MPKIRELDEWTSVTDEDFLLRTPWAMAGDIVPQGIADRCRKRDPQFLTCLGLHDMYTIIIPVYIVESQGFDVRPTHSRIIGNGHDSLGQQIAGRRVIMQYSLDLGRLITAQILVVATCPWHLG